MTKVSIIVPTYCPGAGLDRVVASLDAQTMPASDFEVVFVDDGSPDDTFARLEKLAAARANVTVAEIPNSGWPSRPRNVGIDLATGDYVVFMDHDDELYPDALAEAHRFAVEQRADVVNTKESVTHGWSWGFSHYQEDLSPTPVVDPESLMPMRPHKLYRRALLDEAGIRFREGRRVIYEDVFFNLEVLAHARRVAVLSSRPFYRWGNTGEQNTGSYGRDADEAWGTFAEIFELIDRLDLEPDARDFLVLHTYRLRVLTMMLGPRLGTRDDAWQRRSLEVAPGFVDRYVPERFDTLLNPLTRPRAHLLRTGRLDLLPLLADVDRGVSATLTADRVAWSPDGVLQVAGQAVWRTADGTPWPVRRDGERVLRALPPPLADAVPDDLVDLTASVDEPEAAITVKDKHTSTDWTLPTTHTVHVEDGPAGTAVTMRVASATDLDRAVFGRRLDGGHWNVGCRLGFAGHVVHGGVEYAGPARTAVVAGRVVVASATKRGRLALEVEAPLRSLLQHTRPQVKQSVVRRAGLRGAELTVPVAGLTIAGESPLPVEVRLRPLAGGRDVVVAGALLGGSDGARLVVPLPRSAVGHRLLVAAPTAHGATALWWTPLVVTRGRFGRAAVARRPVRGRRKKVWGRTSTKGPERAAR